MRTTSISFSMSVVGSNLEAMALDVSLKWSGSASSKRTNSLLRFFTTIPFQMLTFSLDSS